VFEIEAAPPPPEYFVEGRTVPAGVLFRLGPGKVCRRRTSAGRARVFEIEAK